MTELSKSYWKNKIAEYVREDGLEDNLNYLTKLPTTPTRCQLKIKSDATLAGISAFTEVFDYLGHNSYHWAFRELEGKSVTRADAFEVTFELPFNIALSGERLALNLLSRASAVATHTKRFVQKAAPYGIQILDTRKTTPGLKALEKYAVTVGGGKNHRFGSTEILMIKDNHKKFYGGLKQAYSAMVEMAGFYSPIIVEIHDLEELKLAHSMKLKHLMLDNFKPEMVREALTLKTTDCTYELSGGINLDNIETYLIKGVDAISIGALTHNPPPIDMSLKLSPL